MAVAPGSSGSDRRRAGRHRARTRLGPCDAVFFIGGIGWTAADSRRRILEGIEPLGLELDVERNHGPKPEAARISTDASPTTAASVIGSSEKPPGFSMLDYAGVHPASKEATMSRRLPAILVFALLFTSGLAAEVLAGQKTPLPKTITCEEVRVDEATWQKALDLAEAHDASSRADLSAISNGSTPAANRDLAARLLDEWDEAEDAAALAKPFAIRLTAPTDEALRQAAPRHGVKAVLLVQLEVSAEGRVESTRILRSEWGSKADELALACLRKSLFRPARRGRGFVASKTVLYLSF